MDAKQPLSKQVTRRAVLGLIAGAGAAVVVGCGDDEEPAPTATTGAPATAATTEAPATAATEPSALSCVVSPEMTEGPYFVDELLNRSDIREDPSDGSIEEGVPLRLAVTVAQVNGDACTPLTGALVDVWHCNAGGLYSDVEQNNTVGQKFLRGYQLTNEDGVAEFTTVYPGWYMGRAVHIHTKVRLDPDADQGFEFTSQFFFDEAVTDQVYTQAPYSSRGARDTLNETDNIYSGGGDQMLLALTPEGEGYLGTISIGVQMS